MKYTPEYNELFKQLVRQFGKKDAEFFILNPSKFVQHYDADTRQAYDNIKEQ